MTESGFDCARRIAAWLVSEREQQHALREIDRAEARWQDEHPPLSPAARKAAEIVRTCRTEDVA